VKLFLIVWKRKLTAAAFVAASSTAEEQQPKGFDLSVFPVRPSHTPLVMSSTTFSPPPPSAGDHPRVLLRGFLSRETCKVLSFLPETAVPLKPAVCIVWRARRVRAAGAGVRAPELRRRGVPPLGGVDVSASPGGHRLRPPPAPVRTRPRAPPRSRGVLLRLPLRSLHRVYRAYQVHTCLVAWNSIPICLVLPV